MAKIVIECANPNDFSEVVESAERAAGSCTITYAKQHLEMVESGTSKSKRESARIISEDSGETPKAVEHKINRGLKELPPHDGAQKSKPSEIITNPTPEIIQDRKPQGGGARENAGRPASKPNLEIYICKQCGREYESIDFAYKMDGGRCSDCQRKMAASNHGNGDNSDAIYITSIIISQLERIKKNDPKRQEAFGIIIKWIEANK